MQKGQIIPPADAAMLKNCSFLSLARYVFEVMASTERIKKPDGQVGGARVCDP